jgi:hypothetical protein
MAFYTFHQNNSGGYFVGPHYIIIEADSPEDAEAQAIRIAVDEGRDNDLSITVGYVDEVKE